MKKSLISMICFTLLVSFFCSTSQVHAVNFEGQEDKYMKLCSSKSLSNSNYNTCKQFNSYLKKKNNQLQSSSDESKSKYREASSKCNPPLEKDELNLIWKSAAKFYKNKVVTNPNYTKPEEYNKPTEIKWDTPIPFEKPISH